MGTYYFPRATYYTHHTSMYSMWFLSSNKCPYILLQNLRAGGHLGLGWSEREEGMHRDSYDFTVGKMSIDLKRHNYVLLLNLSQNKYQFSSFHAH